MKIKLLLAFPLPSIKVSSTCPTLPSAILHITQTKHATILLLELEVKSLVESTSVTVRT
jgi:hypothetical protein